MSDPTRGKRLRAGQRWEPSALAAVPSDWAAMLAAGTPYVAVIDAHPDDPAQPVLRYVLLSSAGGITGAPVTVDDGAGGFAIVFDNDGNVVYA